MILDRDEIAALAASHGEPAQWSRVLDATPGFVHERQKRAGKKRGEIVLVMPRPNGRVLVHTKQFYPAGAYRLLSGGIEMGERIEDAAQRELREETGLDAALARFLGIVEYEFHSGIALAPWVSHVFMTSETRDEPHAADSSEGIAEFRAVEWGELARIADTLEQLPDPWRDWGRFRAIAHRFVLKSIADS